MKDRMMLDAVMDAVSSIEFSKTGARRDLDILSSRSRVEDIEAVPGGIFETDAGFMAAATIYVDLNDGENNEQLSTTDSFPAQVQGHFEPDGRAVVDSVSIDTSSFYD